MKTLSLIALALTLSSAHAAVRYMNDVYAEAAPKDKAAVTELMRQMKALPAKNNQQVFEVTKIEKDSFYERQGIKIGDYLVNGVPRGELTKTNE